MKLSAVFSCMSHLTLTALISIKLAASYRPKGIRAATKGIRHYAWACPSESKIVDGSSDGGISYTKLLSKGSPILLFQFLDWKRSEFIIIYRYLFFLTISFGILWHNSNMQTARCGRFKNFDCLVKWLCDSVLLWICNLTIIVLVLIEKTYSDCMNQIYHSLITYVRTIVTTSCSFELRTFKSHCMCCDCVLPLCRTAFGIKFKGYYIRARKNVCDIRIALSN